MPQIIYDDETAVGYLGIDPGINGGLALVTYFQRGGIERREVDLWSMPSSEEGVVKVFEAIVKWSAVKIPASDLAKARRQATRHLPGFRELYVTIEQVSPASYGAGRALSSMCKLYGSYMSVRMLLSALHVKYNQVTPKAWQKLFGITPRVRKGDNAESDTDWKNRLKKRAEEIFRNASPTLATSDALLIAEYGHFKHTGIRTFNNESYEQGVKRGAG